MKTPHATLLVVLLTVALGGEVSAQLTLNDANASLTINGKTPHMEDSVNHVVLINVTSVTLLDLHINSGMNSNVGVILAGSGSPITAPVLPLPWGDSLDIGTPLPPPAFVADAVLLYDGVGLTVNPLTDIFARTNINGDLHVTGTLSPGLASLADPSTAFQAIVQDPTASPYFFDATEAGDASLFLGRVTTNYVLPDDGSIPHALTLTIDFGGSGSMGMFNVANINSNGFISFGAGSNDFTATMPEFFNGWGTVGNSGVACAWSDLNPGGVNSGATYTVVEDTALGTVQFQFNNQVWFGSNTSAGSFSATFFAAGTPNAGSVILDLTGLTPDPANPDVYVVGVTDGDASLGNDTDLTNGSNTGFVNAIGAGGYLSLGSPDSVGELFSSSLGGPPPTITFLSLGNFLWFIL